ncbi:hypothetical protein BDZ45DRAFT_581744 [Acephala macrosclerotiorum]|nr:hypothetical protein BDZ45DRAFT_581744 [Acephala macrosclerotiorum]
MSGALRALTDGGRMKPTVDQALDTRNLPFVEYCRNAKVDQWGVVKIRNIPYCCNRPEVLAFLGRNARIISEQDYEPVHIVMERVTSKTLDCFVEFINFGEAVAAVQRFESNRTGGRGGRLGQRHVEMELSSQSALMAELFPKAKNVEWRNEGQLPIIHETDPSDKYNSGFGGFLSKEELVMLTKHVECPQRSPFSKECPQRPFECLISTLLKYPWYMVDYITIEDRDLLFEATIKLLELLRDRLDGTRENKSEWEIHITPMLYKRCWRAALKCPGFSPTMKDEVVVKLHLDEMIAQEMGVPIFAAEYKYLWTIGNKPGAPHDMMLWYAAIIREHTSQKERLSLAEKAAKGEGDQAEKLFGDLHKHFGHPKDTKVFKHLTLAQVAANEWAGFETVLRQALTPALEG